MYESRYPETLCYCIVIHGECFTPEGSEDTSHVLLFASLFSTSLRDQIAILSLPFPSNDRVIMTSIRESIQTRTTYIVVLFSAPNVRGFVGQLESFCCFSTALQCFTVPAPRIFPIAYNMVKIFLSEDTKRKIIIVGSKSCCRYNFQF